MTDVSKFRFGVIGLGMGASHASALHTGAIPGACLAALCDVDEARRATYRDWSGVALYDDPARMFAEAGLDAVVVATPHYSHPTLGRMALEAGLHVLVEKPIAVHKADAEFLLATPRRPGQLLAAMFNQRTDPCYRRLKEMIDGGELGRIVRINWIITDWFRTEEYYRSGGWRATWAGEGGGVLLNQCPHQLDLIQWLFGMPARVRAFCRLGRYHEIEVEDDVTAYLDYANGASGVFIASTGEAPGTNRLEVMADGGRVVIESRRLTYDKNLVPTAEFCRTSTERFAKPATETRVETFADSGEQHTGILKNLVAAMRGEAPLVAPAEDGIRSVELANGMLYSSITGATVEFPLDGAVYRSALENLIAHSTLVKAKPVLTNPNPADFGKSF